MPRYRRRYGEGGTFAFTVCLADRRQTTLTDHIGPLRGAFARVLDKRPVRTEAICILPDHLHAVWTLPDHDTDYATRWRLIKRAFSATIGASVWQKRYWEHTIRSDNDLTNHVNYVHFNPVKHGLVTDMDDWPDSSWHRWKRVAGRNWQAPEDVRM